MILNRLKIENFKGIRLLEMNPEGCNMAVHGKNGSGKTTIMDAVTWLLFGKDSTDRKDFEIKAFDKYGNLVEESRKVDHSVEAEFDTVTLRRVYREKWTTKRGSAIAEFASNTTEYYIGKADSLVPKTEKEYKAAVAEICPEDVFKVLTNPLYFHRILPWKDRRAALIRDFGNVSDADVFAANPDIASLQDALRDVKLDELKKQIAAEKAKIKKRIDEIPARVDELNRVEGETGDKEALQAQAEAATIEKNEAYRRGEDMKNGQAAAEKRNRLSQLKIEETNLRGKFAEADEAINAAVRDSNYKIRSAFEDIKRRLATTESRILTVVAEIDRVKETRKKASEQWTAENDRTFEYHEGQTTCPTCGQHLPEEALQAARETAIASFNVAKAAKLSEIATAGNATTPRLAELRAELAALQATAEELRPMAQVPPVEAHLTTTDYTETPEYAAIIAERERLNTEIEQIEKDAEPIAAKVREEIAAIDAKRSEILKKIATIDASEASRKRVTELMAEEKTLATRFEELSKQQYMADQFTMRLCDMVADAVNSHFRVVKWKLFNLLQNGGVEECCEALYNGVPATSNASRSENTKIGLDIIRTMAEKYGFSAPIFIDDRESTTEIPDMNGIQIINLYVNAEAGGLRWEKE